MKEKGPHSAAAATTTSLDDKNDAKGEEEAKDGDTASVGSMFKSGMGIKL
jgi:hypothetical protein